MRGGEFYAFSSTSFAFSSSSAVPSWRRSSYADWFPDVMCRKPFTKDGVGFGCGQCLPCRLNKKRQWAHRLVLEGFQHADKAFVTLTLDDRFLDYSVSVDGEFLATLVPGDLSGFVKRLRERLESIPIRFYGVGEYGDEKGRPHYHILLFGYPSCLRGRTLRDPVSGQCDWRGCCINCRLIGEVWGKGVVELGECNFESTSYIAEYVIKKWTVDRLELRGRHPEFARMSLRPGIGYSAMHEVASVLMHYGLDKRDVPGALRHGAREMPLGRYLRSRLRELVGKDGKAPSEVLDVLKSEMSVVRQAAFDCALPFAEVLSAVDDGKYANLAALQEVFRKRRVLK